MTQQPTRAGEALEQARKEARLGQAAFARQLGLSRSTYLRRIAGEARFTADELVIAKKRYDLDLIDLIDV